MRAPALISVCLIFLPLWLEAQTDFVSDWWIVQWNNEVRVHFTVAAGESYCLGADLERSVDGGPYEVVASIAGVCGGSEYEESYLIDDPHPVAHAAAAYRMNFGTIGRTEDIVVVFIPLDNGALVFPNPCDAHTQLLFDEVVGDILEWSWMGMDGRELDVPVEGSRGSLQFSTSGLDAGHYLLRAGFSDGSFRTFRIAVVR